MEKVYIYNGQETNYIITSDGRIFNKKTKRELNGAYLRNGYHSVQLMIDGKPKSFMTHHLVAEMFCDNPNNYEIVEHIDRNKYNNNYTNLRWVNNSTNMLNINNIDLNHLDSSQWIKVKRSKDGKKIAYFSSLS